jgi:hypothetical protein
MLGSLVVDLSVGDVECRGYGEIGLGICLLTYGHHIFNASGWI